MNIALKKISLAVLIIFLIVVSTVFIFNFFNLEIKSAAAPQNAAQQPSVTGGAINNNIPYSEPDNEIESEADDDNVGGASGTPQAVSQQFAPSAGTPVTGNSGSSIFAMSEVSKHSTPSDCYLVINNKVYDISSFIGNHPGGAGAITSNCGKEVTGIFAKIHSNAAWDLLVKYYVGNIK